MLRKESEAVSEGNGPVHQEEFRFGQPALADEYREIRNLSKQQEIRLAIGTAFSMPRAWRSAATSCHRGRRARKHQDSRAHGGRRYSSTSDAWG